MPSRYLDGVRPRLVLTAHGTRHAPGNDVVRALARGAGSRIGRLVEASYVELCEPSLADVLAAEPPVHASVRPAAVVVPCLLSTGFHVNHDLPAMAADAPGVVRLTPPLGPDPMLAEAQVCRLSEAGARRGEPVTMVAAGSNDADSQPDLREAARLLAHLWGGEVRLATLSGLGRRPEVVVRRGDAVSPYLLAPGFFADRTVATAEAAGAGQVAEPIGAHPRVVDLVVSRLRLGVVAVTGPLTATPNG